MSTGGFDRDGFPDLNLGEPVPPRSIVPAPAATNRNLRGRRVIVGLPGLGWRSDLRADDPVVQGSRTFVPVLPEQEWYRAEVEQTEVFAPLVPVERVWVETVAPAAIGVLTHRNRDVLSRLVSLDAPPARAPASVSESGGVTGRRVVQVVIDDDAAPVESRDLRAVTEPYASAEGDICVRVAAELNWYQWAWTGNAPKTLAIPIHLLWIE